MVDENECRKPGFESDQSVPIVLADSQAWYFPKPWLEIRPRFRGGHVIEAKSVFTYDKQVDELLEAVRQGPDEYDSIAAIASLGAYMLSWNYELSDSELDTLFCFRLGDAQSETWTKGVINLAMGQSGPKLCSGGNGSHC